MNANEPAFPGRKIEYSGTYGQSVTTPGLTKREYFAVMAMQGLLASHPDQIHNSYEGVSVALTWADELLKRLEK